MNDGVSEKRRREVETESKRFEEFCTDFGVPAAIVTAPLYLTWRSEQGANARAIRRAVGALNTAARMRNEQPWGESEAVGRWLRGYHREAPIGASEQRSDPLYAEKVSALAEACRHPSRSQRLATAAMILSNSTGLPPIALARLKWSDVRIRASRECVEVDPPPFERRGPRSEGPLLVEKGPPGACLIMAMRDLKPDRRPGPFVFGGIGSKDDMVAITRMLDRIPGRGPGLWPRPRLTPERLVEVIEEVNRPSPSAARDLALVVISHQAALTGLETMHLHQSDFRSDGHTLTIEVPGRREPVHLWTNPGSPSCPVDAWEIWMAHLQEQGKVHGDSPIFRVVSGSRIWDKPMTYVGLNRTVQTRAQEARLTGGFTFTGLRQGAIRGWLRDGVSELHVASRAGLVSLDAVAYHERRESLMSKSIAGMIGL